MYRPTFAIVDLRAFRHNISLLHRRLSPGTRMMVAVKADAYGHGISAIIKVIEESDVASVAVATLDEAIAIRQLGSPIPVLVLGALGVQELIVASALDIEVTHAETWGNISELPHFERPLRIHMEFDTGMNRMGMKSMDEVRSVVKQLHHRSDMEWVATFTHLAAADSPADKLAEAQVERFRSMLSALRSDGIDVPDCSHVANSAGVLRNLTWHFDMVRIGIAAYGYSPDEDVVPFPELRPVMHLYSAVTRIAVVESGEVIGYGATYEAHRPMRVATICIGYADGVMRILSNRGMVMIRGAYVPIVGRVCMDQLMVDVTDVDDVQVGDFATMFGNEVPAELTATRWRETVPEDRMKMLNRVFVSAELEQSMQLPLPQVAASAETIPYEFVCQIGSRVPKVYVDESSTKI